MPFAAASCQSPQDACIAFGATGRSDEGAKTRAEVHAAAIQSRGATQHPEECCVPAARRRSFSPSPSCRGRERAGVREEPRSHPIHEHHNTNPTDADQPSPFKGRGNQARPAAQLFPLSLLPWEGEGGVREESRSHLIHDHHNTNPFSFVPRGAEGEGRGEGD